ncbi:4,5-DOPA dioxygenase extradiol [Shewanella dokdonensis]|nr:4,5-DOPA dioxygenase extradiol [Shewanella dokdonensis]MCL1076264.1 4,5-DOPA dioxygenase extradiol [Shewanella dokdonensis]
MLERQSNTGSRMPAIFVGHGSPMNAIEETAYTRQWQQWGQQLPVPKAILVISAHWLTYGTAVTGSEQPETIHDFGGFPAKLYAQQYSAPGDPQLAQQLAKTVGANIIVDDTRGLDHGVWSVLMHMYPQANIPVLQLSIDPRMTPQQQYALGRQLRPLREQGILLVGSGNVVHNLRVLRFDGPAYPWAQEFTDAVASKLQSHDDAAVLDYKNLVSPQVAQMCHPTDDHLQPLFYLLGTSYDDEPRQLFNNSIDLRAIAMLSLQIG